MSDTNGAPAPAPASTPAPNAPSPDDQATPKPNPATTDPKPAEKAPTSREALQKAKVQVEKDNPTPKPVESKTPAKPAPKVDAKAAPADKKAPAPSAKVEPGKEPAPRGDHGHFAAKTPAEQASDTQDPKASDGKASDDPKVFPKRFNPQTQADWDKTPDTVKAEVHRATRELEQGLGKYKERAERDQSIDHYHKNTQDNGTTVREALDRYTTIESAWRDNPINGFLAVCGNLDADPVETAKMVYETLAHAAGRGEIKTGEDFKTASRESQLQQREQRLQQDEVMRSAGDHVKSFIDSGEAPEFEARAGAIAAIIKYTQVGSLPQAYELATQLPRFDEVAEHVDKLLQTGYASNLREAYDAACKLIPDGGAAPLSQAPSASSAPADDRKPQTQRGNRSIAGAPSAGSDPDAVARTPSTSIRDSLRRAVDRAAG